VIGERQADPEEVLRRLEPQYFLDYTLFSGVIRHHVAHSLEQAYRGAPGDVHRRLFLLGVVKEEYAAYEDLAAILLAFLRWRSGDVPLPIKPLLEYAPGEAVIDGILNDRRIATGEDLYAALRLEEWLPSGWRETFPDIDLRKALKIACTFFVLDCRRNQKHPGIKAYNKIKHGAMIVPDASLYIPTLPSTPAAIFQTLDRLSPNPYTLYAIPMEDEHIEERLRSINFVQVNLRLLSGLYIINRYPAALQSCGYEPPFMLLAHDLCEDVCSFLREVTAKK
jgi:hypothetical protein